MHLAIAIFIFATNILKHVEHYAIASNAIHDSSAILFCFFREENLSIAFIEGKTTY